MKQPAVYILTNKRQGTLYIGVTSNLVQRVYQHQKSLTQGFTSRYSCVKLVYFETYESMLDAIAREKQLKASSRLRKIRLIENLNPSWNDLYTSII